MSVGRKLVTEEYEKEIIDEAEREVVRYEHRLSRHFGSEIHLA